MIFRASNYLEITLQSRCIVNLMINGSFPFPRLLVTKRMLKPNVYAALVANTIDITHKEGEGLPNAGFVSAYHALRLGQGRDTPFEREKPTGTIKGLKDIGLQWINCVDPMGPEHSH